MSRSFDAALNMLAARATQVLAFHRITCDSVRSDQRIAHFTSWTACLEMLEQAVRENYRRKARGEPDLAFPLELWASDVSCLNDTLEGKALRSFAHQAATEGTQNHEAPAYVTGQWLRDHSSAGNDCPFLTVAEWKELDTNLTALDPDRPELPVGISEPVYINSGKDYLISFCREYDRLDLWRAYADKAEGVSLAMSIHEALDGLAALGDQSWGLFQVAYGDRAKTRALVLLREPLKRVAAHIRRIKDKDAKAQAVSEALKRLSLLPYLFKHEQFRTEQEIRLIPLVPKEGEIELPGNLARAVVKTGRFFLSCNSTVTLGPRCPERNNRTAVLGVRLRQLFGDNAPPVKHSTIPYQ